MARKLIRITAVAEKLGGVHETHAWRLLGSDESAPKAIRLSPRHTVFDEDEIDAWVEKLVEAARGKPAKKSLPSVDAVRRGAETRKANRQAVAA